MRGEGDGGAGEPVEPVKRRPSLREQIPHLSPAQLRVLRNVARAGGRLPGRALPQDVATSLLAARALRAERAVRQRRVCSDLWLTHLGLLALVQAANQFPGRDDAGFCAVILDHSELVSSLGRREPRRHDVTRR